MPCYDGREADDRAEAHRKVELLTRVACEMAKLLAEDVPSSIPHLSQEAQDWIAEHRKLDAKHAGQP